MARQTPHPGQDPYFDYALSGILDTAADGTTAAEVTALALLFLGIAVAFTVLGLVASLAGTLFGVVAIKSEIVSWYRIQEMFRFESFHMYGVIGTAVVVGAISVLLIKRVKARTIYGEEIHIPNKTFNKGQIYGGLTFGLGWAITGACPGPLFAQIGAGFPVIIVTFLSAWAGTWVYGRLREQLPH